jgi:acetyl esterase/lipase
MRVIHPFFILSFLLVAIQSSGASEHTLLSNIGTYEVIEDDFVYLTEDGIELRAHSYRARKNGILPSVIDVHGGAWNFGDRMAGQNYDKALASSGIYVLAIDFRQAPAFQHPLGSRDVVSAIRYLINHAEKLTIETENLGLIGSSSGGHLALLAGLKPNAQMHSAITEESTLNEREKVAVKYIIALWPVSDPHYRYHYAKKAGRDRLVTAHDNYFNNEDEMKDASIQRILNSGEATENLPPVMIVEPGEDLNIPREMTLELMKSFQNAGGKADHLFYPGMPHAFANRESANSASTDDLILAMRDFINRQLSGR